MTVFTVRYIGNFQFTIVAPNGLSPFPNQQCFTLVELENVVDALTSSWNCVRIVWDIDDFKRIFNYA